MTEGFFVYILASRRNGTLYVGVTNDLSRRIADHRARLVPGFTRKYRVDKLVHVDAFSSILEARSYERALSRWKRSWKLGVIEKEQSDLAGSFGGLDGVRRTGALVRRRVNP